MSTVAEEQVLVVPTKVLHEIGHFQGFSPEVDKYLPALLDCGDVSYRPRGEMEEDPSFKQLIPYVVFCLTDAERTRRIFNYRRGGGGGEERLRAKRSVGVGGHISTLDTDSATGSADSSGDVYRRGLLRELAEEVRIDTPYTESTIGLINDDETPVGKVHLGVVHLFEVEKPEVFPLEDDIQDTCFQTLEELSDNLDSYETWSQIAVRALLQK